MNIKRLCKAILLAVTTVANIAGSMAILMGIVYLGINYGDVMAWVIAFVLFCMLVYMAY
jgi:hypothetical protein